MIQNSHLDTESCTASLAARGLTQCFKKNELVCSHPIGAQTNIVNQCLLRRLPDNANPSPCPWLMNVDDQQIQDHICDLWPSCFLWFRLSNMSWVYEFFEMTHSTCVESCFSLLKLWCCLKSMRWNYQHVYCSPLRTCYCTITKHVQEECFFFHSAFSVSQSCLEHGLEEPQEQHCRPGRTASTCHVSVLVQWDICLDILDWTPK